MMDGLLMTGLSGEMRRNEPMSRHTSWRAGGAARWFYAPRGLPDLCEFLQRIPAETEIAWCGLGSNMLVRDGGFDGVMISTRPGLRNIEKISDRGIYAQAGVPSAKLAKFAAGNALCGTEFMAGIPGTVGGALAMNAGCFGSETWDRVRYADTVNRCGETQRRDASQVSWGYRSVQLDASEWFTGAEFGLQPCHPGEGKKRINGYLKKRAATQPIQTANSGSVFRNPNRDFAARLIDLAGLKGHVMGGARVSPRHANFIENLGHANAADIEALINFVKERVDTVHGVQLQLEVRIIGERKE